MHDMGFHRLVNSEQKQKKDLDWWNCLETQQYWLWTSHYKFTLTQQTLLTATDILTTSCNQWSTFMSDMGHWMGNCALQDFTLPNYMEFNPLSEMISNRLVAQA